MKEVVEVATPILTLIIAGFVALMILRQNQISRDQLRLALFKKRYDIYDGVKDLIGAAVTNAAVSNQDITAFSISTQGSVFLFEADIQEYLQEVRTKAADLHRINVELNDRQLQKGKKRSQLVEEDRVLLNWFSAQYKVAAQKFHKYLYFKTHL